MKAVAPKIIIKFLIGHNKTYDNKWEIIYNGWKGFGDKYKLLL